MRNKVFLNMDSEYARRPEESEQQYMERILKEVCAPEDGTVTFNEKIMPEFFECSAEERTVTLKFTPIDWQSNQDNRLHGGVIAAAHDMTMGFLSKFYLDNKNAVTIQMGIEYMRSVGMNKDYYVKAYCVKSGRRACFLRSDLIGAESGLILSCASGVYI